MALPQHAYSRIAQQVRIPSPSSATPWSAPSLPELVSRIDAALRTRQAS